jgi:hypothetical protein
MSTATQNIVNKAWNFAHVLRDDGLSYMPVRQIARDGASGLRQDWISSVAGAA